jgi:hypothetical protein
VPGQAVRADVDWWIRKFRRRNDRTFALPERNDVPKCLLPSPEARVEGKSRKDLSKEFRAPLKFLPSAVEPAFGLEI